MDDGGNVEGVQLEYDGETVVAITSKDTRDAERWRETMPSLSGFPGLTELDLHKNRYITTLDPSITSLSHLKVLKLSQCSRLGELPSSIGDLKSLQVVRVL